ncbi:ARM repeat-containing protein [Leucogyrophana mollusca]|uniref:ARM repeat-containing protein n=1 Tax=Leucogyrophana mollusca TaxID=85980 RepID=A0ACB8BQZ6_9AGAM|nr:ARM repeat-containing protein [Leucogyrophana mollusca]
MESVERSVRSWLASGKDTELDETVSGIINGQITLVDVVKALGQYLTSEEDELRSKGVDFLSSVLGKCPLDKLNRQAVRVLVAFHCSKLEDTETITPALKGLAFLVKFPPVEPSDASDILSALFKHVKMKALVQSTRFFVFSIIDTLLVKHIKALRDMGREFLDGYVGLAEGEKDPRNLLLAFAIARVLLTQFDISHKTDDLFDITFCYFPITFRPPPGDPYGISAEDLKKALSACLSATPLFGRLGIPVFLEKLTAGSPTTKRDTLQTMTQCLPVYGAPVARDFGRKIWSSLKLEILQPIDPQTESEALSTLQVFVRTIQGSEASSGEVAGLAKDICEECIAVLREPEKAQAKAAMKVLCAFVTVSPTLSQFAISQATQHLVSLFHNPDEVPSRPAVIILLSDLVHATRDASSTAPTPPSRMDNATTDHVPLQPSKDDLLGVFTVGLKTPSTVESALRALQGMVTTTGLFTDEEFGFIVHAVDELIQGDNVEDISDNALSLLSAISTTAPHHVADQILPLFFSSLPDRAPVKEAQDERAAYWRALSALSTLCVHPALFEIFVVRLTTKLDLLSGSLSGPGQGSELETVPAYAHSILTAISKTLAAKVEKKDADVPKYVDRLLPWLFKLFINASLVKAASLLLDPRLLQVAGRIISLVVETLPLERQQRFTELLFGAYLKGDVQAITDGLLRIPSDTPFHPLNSDATTPQRYTVVLFSAAVVSLRKEITLPVENLGTFLELITMWSDSREAAQTQREAAWHILASVVNKHTEEPGISSFLTARLDVYWLTALGNRDATADTRRHSISLWAWITKALLVRSHPISSQFVDRFFELLGDDAVDWDAARAIGGLGSGDIVLTKRNFAVVKVLHAQKFFNMVLPRILEGAKVCDGSRQETAYLVALASLIDSVPKATYRTEMSSLMPLLLRALDLPDPTIRASIIATLTGTLKDVTSDSTTVSSYASTLVLAMLKNCMLADSPEPRVRTAALRYLSLLPGTVRYDLLHPYKSQVLKELAKVLDDPKRAVRKEAVYARTNWFKYNG